MLSPKISPVSTLVLPMFLSCKFPEEEDSSHYSWHWARWWHTVEKQARTNLSMELFSCQCVDDSPRTEFFW